MSGFPPKVRTIIHQRADWWCECCGLQRGFQLHHRRPRGMGSSSRPGTNEPSNGLWVCLECHNRIEGNRVEAIQNGWLVPQTTDPATTPVLYRGTLVFLDDLGNLTEAAA